jgi:hypothetical protein
MTGIYEWNPMPHIVDVRCPKCFSHAIFEFAEIVRIHRNEDLEFFQESKQFDYKKIQDSNGHFWHGAIYFAGLHGNPIKSISNLPLGYEPNNWSHSGYLYRRYGHELGSVICQSCGLRLVKQLDWPKDAYFAISHKKFILWAFNRESALELLDYISASSRNLSKYKWKNFLLHLPTVFKSRKARSDIVKLLNRLLL